jgi:hypothetical protein
VDFNFYAAPACNLSLCGDEKEVHARRLPAGTAALWVAVRVEKLRSSEAQQSSGPVRRMRRCCGRRQGGGGGGEDRRLFAFGCTRCDPYVLTGTCHAYVLRSRRRRPTRKPPNPESQCSLPCMVQTLATDGHASAAVSCRALFFP